VRTTLSLDDDVAALLNKEVRRSGSSFKEAVNRCLRAGLTSAGRERVKPFKVQPFPLNLPPNLSYDNVAELLDELDSPTHS
jgi:ribbon-helix-helix CopG family protein